jgi:predicted nucleic acid-binding protein
MRLSLYLETSVVGAYLDNDDTFRRDLTIRWWEHEMSEYSVFSSQLVIRELERTHEPHRTGYLNLVNPFDQLDINEEIAILAEEYIHRGIFHRKFLADAVHYALASFHKIDYLVTWNFGYLANVRKQARLRLFNSATGFFTPTVVTPEFLVHAV